MRGRIFKLFLGYGDINWKIPYASSCLQSPLTCVSSACTHVDISHQNLSPTFSGTSYWSSDCTSSPTFFSTPSLSILILPLASSCQPPSELLITLLGTVGPLFILIPSHVPGKRTPLLSMKSQGGFESILRSENSAKRMVIRDGAKEKNAQAWSLPVVHVLFLPQIYRLLHWDYCWLLLHLVC